MDRIRQMQIFIQVMESGNFTRAAEKLAIPRSTVSTEVQLLEDRLKTQLLARTTRRVVPTEDGRRFLAAAREIVEAVSLSEGMFLREDQQVTGRLRVAMPSRIGHLAVLPALPDFLDRHPGLSIDLSASDRITDLVADSVDCVLRLGTLEDSDLICRPLGQIPFVTCASPAYLARHGTPRRPEDLGAHAVVNYAPQLPAGPAALDFWQGDSVASIPMRSQISVDSVEAYIGAARAGLGLIQLPRFELAGAAADLIEVMTDHPAPPLPLSFLYVRRRNLAPRVRVFQAWLEGVLTKAGVVLSGPLS